jgi:hypothetical protein
MRVCPALFFLLLIGCGPKVGLHYHLTPEALAPPPVRSALKVRGVASAEACEIHEGPLVMGVRGRDAVLRLGPGSTTGQLEQFRGKVLASEDSGCLVKGGANRVLTVVASSLALPPMQLYNVRYGNYQNSASLDLDENFRLKTVSPLLATGVKDVKIEAVIPDTPGVIAVKPTPGLEGFETSYYDLQPVPGGGIHPAVTSVEQTRNGKTMTAPKPTGFSLELPPAAGHLRLVSMHADTRTIHDIVLLAAESYAALDAATHRLESSEDVPALCRAEREAFCLLVPKLSIIASQLRVTANGKAVYVPFGGSVGSALREAGENQKPAHLRVLRPWHDKMIPVVSSTSTEKLLGLVLIGGEQIDG